MKRKNLDRDQRVWEEINMSYHFLLDLALILLSTKILAYVLCGLFASLRRSFRCRRSWAR